MHNVDARGMSCPQPVLMTKNIVAEGVDAIEVIVDSQCASNNITRFLTQNGFKTIDCTQKDDCIYIRASK